MTFMSDPSRPAPHPVFQNFVPFHGQVRKGEEYDFLGTTIRPEFIAYEPSNEILAVAPDYPSPDEEYFEWIDLLESVISSGPSYTMMELGAGVGRWAVRAGVASRQLNKTDFTLIAVEAEPTHFSWMSAHFRNNGLDPAAHKLIHAAVADKPGSVSFLVGGPFGGSPSEWYGQAVTDWPVLERLEDEHYNGLPIQLHGNGWKSVAVPAVTIDDLLSETQVLDLLDMDIQGHELSVVLQSINTLDQKVRRMHIGTHSGEIESGLRELLREHGWCCLADYSGSSTAETPWGPISFQDGVQSWINPRLVS